MSTKKTFTAGKTRNGSLNNAGQALRNMEAQKTWRFDYIHRENLIPNTLNKQYPQNGILALAESIKRQGLMQNIDVIPDKDGKYRIIAGERRYRAISSLSKDEYDKLFPSGVPAKIEDQSLDAVDEEIMLIEANYLGRGDGLEHSADISAEERFASYSNMKRWEIGRLKELYKIKNIDLSTVQINEKIADQLNISSRQVYNYLSVNKLIPELDQLFTEGKLTLKQGSKIGNLPEDAQMEVYNMLSQTGEVSDSEIKMIKERAKEREEAFSKLEEELSATKIKLRQQEATIEALNHDARDKTNKQPDLEEIVLAKERLQSNYNTLQTRYDALEKEKAKLKESLRELTPEETAKAKAELQISQSISSIRNAISILDKNKEFLTDSSLLAKVINLQDELNSITSKV